MTSPREDRSGRDREDPVDDLLRSAGGRWRSAQEPPSVDWDAVTDTPGHGRWLRPVAAAAATALIIVGVAWAVPHGARHPAPVGPVAPTAPVPSTASPPATSPPATSPPATSPPTTAPLAFDVPWVDRPAPPPAPLSPLPVTLSSDAPPCTAAQVEVDGEVDHSGISQDLGVIIPFRNVSGTTCLLTGVPHVVAHSADGPDYTAIPKSTDVFGPSSNIGPGEITDLHVANAASCPAAPGGFLDGRPVYDSVDVTIPGGGSIHVGGLKMYTACAITVDHFFGPTPQKSYAPGPLQGATATLTLPPTVRAGDVLQFVVTLTNPTGATVSAQPCPGYLISDSDVAAPMKQSFALNCDTVTALGPGQSVRYQMQVDVPRATAPGPLTVRWEAEGAYGPRASGTVLVVSDAGTPPAGS